MNRGFLSQAGPFEQRAHKDIDALKRGVEKAAESVLGDEVEALRLARRELETLSQQLETEIAQGDTNNVSTKLLASASDSMQRRYGGRQPLPAAPLSAQPADSQTGADSKETSGQQSGQTDGEGKQSSDQQSGSRDRPARNGGQNAQSQAGNGDGANSPQQQSASGQEQKGSSGSQGQRGNSEGQRANRDGGRQNGQRPAPTLASGSPNSRTGRGGGGGGNFFDGGARTGGFEGGGVYGPLTGDDFVDW